MALTHSAVGWSAVCDCGISESYSLAFFLIYYPFLQKRVVKKNIVHLSNSESLHQGITKSYFVLFDIIL